MLALREIIYTFLLVALLHSIVLCFNELTALLQASETQFAQTYRTLRCGRLLAARANLHASVATVRYYRPALPAATQAQLSAAVHNFHRHYPDTLCAKIFDNIEVYRHDNEQLPEFWPNYVFRWRP